MSSVWTVIVAAGEGQRFGRQKQFDLLRGRIVLEYSIEAARTHSDGIVLVVPSDRLEDTAVHGGADVIVAGGSTRSQSVRNGLSAVPDDAGVVAVHDAARPLASADLFKRVIDGVKAGSVAVVPGVAVTDTIKRVANGIVTETIDRDALIAVQTPQAFDAATLRLAHGSSADATDDAALLEMLGVPVTVVQGEFSNRKITDLSDLQLFDALIEAKERE